MDSTQLTGCDGGEVQVVLDEPGSAKLPVSVEPTHLASQAKVSAAASAPEVTARTLTGVEGETWSRSSSTDSAGSPSSGEGGGSCSTSESERVAPAGTSARACP